VGALTPRAPRDNLGGVIRRPLTSRLLPLVTLLVLFALAAPLGVAAQTRYRVRLASAPAGGTK
jgi:hypothetical protein